MDNPFKLRDALAQIEKIARDELEKGGASYYIAVLRNIHRTAELALDDSDADEPVTIACEGGGRLVPPGMTIVVDVQGNATITTCRC